MIAVLCGPRGADETARRPVERALARHNPQASIHTIPAAQGAILFAGHGAEHGNCGPVVAVIYGWIDNSAELALELACPSSEAGTLYAAAAARWGHAADRHIIGNYAACAVLGDGTLHLARAPWDAPPLHYHAQNGLTVASPLLRVLFAAGVPKAVDHERLVDELAFDWRSHDDIGWYHKTFRVPLGARVRIDGDRREVERWYRPPEVIGHRAYREGEAVEHALGLLDEAAGKALAWARRPALSLSGGLDSPLVASALIEHLGAGERLPAITFVPDREWEGRCAAGTMGDETPLVRELLAAYPQIDWHRASDEVGGMDHRAREVFAACETFAPGLTNVAMVHNVYDTARDLGCETLLVADMGNVTFSEAGVCAYAEYARTGHWSQLLGLLRARAGDPRTIARKLLALAVLPHLPARLRRMLRGLVHPGRRDMLALLTPLSAAARSAQPGRARERGTQSAWSDFAFDLSREATVAREWLDADGPGKDIDLAFEQLYDIRRRDVTAYRRLVEFCMSLPARAFAWDGRERRLTRLMGARRLPAAIAANLLHGAHNVDWHTRQARELAAMREAFAVAREHQWLGEALDLDRMERLLDTWPDAPTFVDEIDLPLRLAQPRGLLLARFLGWLENRNDL